MLWDGITPPETLAASLPPAYSLLESSSNESKGVKFLRVYLDQLAISKYYRDAMKYGDDVFLRTHNGDVHAAMNSSLIRAQEALTEATLRLVDVPKSERGKEWCDEMKSSLVGLL